MAGGVGSRLWPVSTPEMPKQFIDLLGIGKTMIQLTFERFRPVCDPRHFWVVTSESYVDIVRRQLPDVPEGHILAEPIARNTAPCIALASWRIARECPDANIIVTPADALVVNVNKFANVVRKALNFTASGGRIVTVGVKPTRPETGYGYIRAQRSAAEEVVAVREFKEKPDLATANEYLAAGDCFWNAGIFIWTVSTIVSELRRHAPSIASTMDTIAGSFDTAEEKDVLRRLFPTFESISIDYAVMEKSSNIHLVASDFGWSDLGTYSAVGEHIHEHIQESRDPSSGDCKVVGSDVRLFGCKGCVVHADGARTVVVKGLEGYVVAVNDGKVLVCPLEDEQMVKDYSKPRS